jgi:Domain of unknown function (DUF4293)
MIQRPQTLWLMLASLCFILEILPSVIMVKTATVDNNLLTDQILKSSESPILMYGTILSASLAFVSIFLFKNRGNQILTSSIAALIQILAPIAYTFYYLYSVGKFGEMRIDFGLYLGILGIFALWLAIRGIRKDDEKIQSTERLR